MSLSWGALFVTAVLLFFFANALASHLDASRLRRISSKTAALLSPPPRPPPPPQQEQGDPCNLARLVSLVGS